MKKDNSYQFVTLVYNHSDLIEDHLNSILYQKMNYGLDKKVILTLVDDFSTDNSIEIIEKWLTGKNSFFYKVILIKNDENLGIKLNYINSIQFIITNKYKLLGGDDLYLKHSNAFDFMDYASNKSIVFSPILVNNTFKISQKLYVYKLQFFSARLDLLNKVIISSNQFNAPGSYVSPEILKKPKFVEFLRNAREDYEDWPSWKYLFLSEDYHFDIYKFPIIDYRPSSSRNEKFINRNFILRIFFKILSIMNSFNNRILKKNGYIHIIADLYAMFYLIKEKMFHE